MVWVISVDAYVAGVGLLGGSDVFGWHVCVPSTLLRWGSSLHCTALHTQVLSLPS